MSMLPHEQTLLAEAEFTERIHEKEMGIEREELHEHEHHHKHKDHHHKSHHHSHHSDDDHHRSDSEASDSDSDQEYEIVQKVPEDVYLEAEDHQDYQSESHHHDIHP